MMPVFLVLICVSC